MTSKLMRGTFLITLGTILSKVLGALYVIPFYAMIGEENVALYQIGYVPYSIFISIATAGVPLAVAKYIAKYNSLEEYAVGRRLFKSGIYLMMATGIVSFAILYFFAPTFAHIMLANQSNPAFTYEEVTTVIKAVSFALIVVPFMSLIRGFFQGHQSMGPSAVSTVVEQIVRIAFVLVGTFLVLNVFNGDTVTAVSMATFAAFIGGIGSLMVLLWYWKKRKPYLDELLQNDKGNIDVSIADMYKEIIIYAIPFVLVGIANPLYQLIDNVTFSRAFDALAKTADEGRIALGILNFSVHKLVIIPVSLATAFSLSLVPLVTESYVKGERDVMIRNLNQTFQILLFITMPAAIGLALLARPIYTVFYEPSTLGTQVLLTYAPVAILFALFAVTAAILQGINEQRFTMLSLLVGILIKLTLNIPFIKMFETKGAVYATALGYLASITINFIVIRLFIGYPFKLVLRRTILIVLFNLLMTVGVIASYKGLSMILSPDHKLQALLLIIICALIGASIYGYLGLKSKLADRLFGQRLQKLRQKLRLQ